MSFMKASSLGLSSKCSILVNGSLQPQWKRSSPFIFPTGGEQRRTLAEKAVKNRMRSVQSIQKITKAMKTVAASKLRQDQRRREIGLPFCASVKNFFHQFLIPSLGSPTPTSSPETFMLITVTSDKGLCGGVNSAVTRQARYLIRQKEAEGFAVSVMGIGEKTRAALQRHYGSRFFLLITEATRHPLNFAVASTLANRLLEANPSNAQVVFNEYKSAVAYETKTLPLWTTKEANMIKPANLSSYEFEPELSVVWKDLHEFYLANTLYLAMLEGVASEQSARMAAMDNASKNAGQMLEDLTLAYNKARQFKITMELCEIISGTNAT